MHKQPMPVRSAVHMIAHCMPTHLPSNLTVVKERKKNLERKQDAMHLDVNTRYFSDDKHEYQQGAGKGT